MILKSRAGTAGMTQRKLEGSSKLKGKYQHPPRMDVLPVCTVHEVGVKAIVFANTPENQRVTNSVFKVTRIIEIVDHEISHPSCIFISAL